MKPNPQNNLQNISRFCVYIVIIFPLVRTYATEKDLIVNVNDYLKFSNCNNHLHNSKTVENCSYLSETNSPKTDIYILGLFELSDRFGYRQRIGYAELEAANLAIHHVNIAGIISKYRLVLLVNDTQCDPGVGVDRFFHSLYSNKTILMLLDSSCSNVTEKLAHIVPYWNVLQISSGSKSATLSDRKKFPLFFRTIAPDLSHNPAKISFIKHFQWKVVATLSESTNDFLLPINRLASTLEKSNVTCIASLTITKDNYKEQLVTIKNLDVRIILASFSSQLAQLIFCEIHKLNIYGTEFVWILQNHGYSWWKNSISVLSCSRKSIKDVTEGLVLVSGNGLLPDHNTNENVGKILRLNTTKDLTFSILTYDAVWAIALTLNRTMKTYPNLKFESFNYQQSETVRNLITTMNSIDFVGLSGEVSFRNGDRVENSYILQIQNSKPTVVALYDFRQEFLNFQCDICNNVSWSLDRIPIDQRILKHSMITIPTSLICATSLIASTGIILAIVLLLLNINYRAVNTVKMSSPTLNNVAAFGCILVYFSIIFLNLNRDAMKFIEYSPKFCTLGVYLLSVGFSMVFGSMFAKTYRVHRIFSNSRNGKVNTKFLRDQHLICLIMIPPILDGVISSLWMVIDPIQIKVINLTLQYSTYERGIAYQTHVEVCRSENTVGWYLTIYGYKGLLLIMGAFTAWETRHIKIQALNDSHYISICIYSAVFSTILVILSSLTPEYVILSYLLRTLSILGCTTLTLFVVFLPVMNTVCGNKTVTQSDPIMESMGLRMESNTRRLIAENDWTEQIYRLEVQNRIYRRDLIALDLEIERLQQLSGRHLSPSFGDHVKKINEPNSTAETDIFFIFNGKLMQMDKTNGTYLSNPEMCRTSSLLTVSGKITVKARSHIDIGYLVPDLLQKCTTKDMKSEKNFTFVSSPH